MPMVNAFVTARPYEPIAKAGIGDGPASAARDATPLAHKASIRIEHARGARLSEIESEWHDLVARACEANVFMHPALIHAAEQHLPDRHGVTLLAWQGAGESERLVGLWAFVIGSPPHSALPIRVLLAPPVPHGYLATPVIDRAAPEDVLDAMLDFIAREEGLPKIIALDPIAAEGPTMQALARVLSARGSSPFVMARTQRPMLASQLDGKQYFEKALSSSSRKKLRQHRRRLEEKGTLASEVRSGPEPVGKAFEEFLQLEAAGWKGRRGTALLRSQAETAFTRAMVGTLARRGDATIHALYLDGRPVSMQVVLRAGPAAFTWKTAYDEAVHDFSPGMLLLEDYTRAFLADDGIASVDSCAYDADGFMSVWTERQPIAQLWIDARRGPSPRLLALCRLQKAFLGLRAAAKKNYLSWRRKWKAN